MEDHIKELLNRYQDNVGVKEAAAFHLLSGCEDVRQVMQELGIQIAQ